MFGLWRKKDSGKPKPTQHDDEQKVYDDAALQQLWGEIPFLNGVLGDISAARTAQVRTLIAEKRKWVDTLEDPRWRKAFNRWLKHADYCCDGADKYREKRPAERALWLKDEAKRREVKEAARSLLATNPPRGVSK